VTEEILELVSRLAPEVGVLAPEQIARQRSRLAATILREQLSRELVIGVAPTGPATSGSFQAPSFPTTDSGGAGQADIEVEPSHHTPSARRAKRHRRPVRQIAFGAIAGVLAIAGIVATGLATRTRSVPRPVVTSISSLGWRDKVDGVGLAAAHADFDPHPQQVRVFETKVKSALAAMPRPTTLVRLPPGDPAYLVVVSGRLSNVGGYRDGRWVGQPVELVLVVSEDDTLASYWSGTRGLKLAGLGTSVELPTSLPRVPSIPDIFGVTRFAFDGFPVVSRNGRTITVLTVQQCGGPSKLVATSYQDRVALVVTAPTGAPDEVCPLDLQVLTISTTLPEPLGDRVLVNGITGKPVPYFDDRWFADITVLPQRYRCGAGEPGVLPSGGSGVNATVYCSGPAKESGPLAIEQLKGVGSVTASWPIVGHPTIDGHQATLRVAVSSGIAYVRCLTWSAGGYFFTVISMEQMEGQQILSSSELLAVADGLHLPPG